MTYANLPSLYKVSVHFYMNGSKLCGWLMYVIFNNIMHNLNSHYPGKPICVAPDGTVISQAMHSGYMVDMTHHICIANEENR